MQLLPHTCSRSKLTSVTWFAAAPPQMVQKCREGSPVCCRRAPRSIILVAYIMERILLSEIIWTLVYFVFFCEQMLNELLDIFNSLLTTTSLLIITEQIWFNRREQMQCSRMYDDPNVPQHEKQTRDHTKNTTVKQP